MNSQELAISFRQTADQYMEGVDTSLTRNHHMNKYDGEAFDPKVVSEWLHKYAEEFGLNYRGGFSCGDVVDGAVEHAKKYLKSNPLPYKTTTSEAIIVDYLNYLAGRRCGMDLALYTIDMSQ